MANVNYKIINSSTLELEDDSKKGDRIDLTKEVKIDDSFIEDKIYEKGFVKGKEETKRIAEAEFKIKQNELISQNIILQERIKYEVDAAKTQTRSELEKKIRDLEFHNQETQLANEKKIIEQKEQYEKEIKLRDEKINELNNTNKWSHLQKWDEFPDGGLENWCENEYRNRIERYWPQIKFKKDNDIRDEEGNKSRSGTKGDFILEETSKDGDRILSISFEMKNENPNSKTQKKISDHYYQADLNRRKKGCDYCVIVTTLEPNVDFSIRKVNEKEKMYIVRPEFFEEIICRLRDNELNAYEKTKETKNQLRKMEDEKEEVADYFNKIEIFKKEWGKHYNTAKTKFDDAIENINKTIAQLQKFKENILSSGKSFDLADKAFEEVSKKSLTRGKDAIKAILNNEDKKEEN